MTHTKRIAIGADHGGFDLKSVLVAHLRKGGHQVEDFGTSSREAVDYPVFARAVAESVSQGRSEPGWQNSWLTHGWRQNVQSRGI